VEEIAELRQAVAERSADENASAPTQGRQNVEAELGDILFSLVNLARFLKVNPEDALRGSTNRFIDRFHLVEAQAAERGRALPDMTLADMDALWEEAKQRLGQGRTMSKDQRTAPDRKDP